MTNVTVILELLFLTLVKKNKTEFLPLDFVLKLCLCCIIIILVLTPTSQCNASIALKQMSS